MAGSGIGTAAEIIVHPGEYIQAAVDNGGNGSVIILEPGTYNQNVTIDGFVNDLHDITIKSSTGNPDDVIIQGNSEDYNLIDLYYAGPIYVEGITFKSNTDIGTEIIGEQSSTTIKNCKFVTNAGGVGADRVADFDIIKCTFIKCDYATGTSEFGGIYGTDNIFINCNRIITYYPEVISFFELRNSVRILTDSSGNQVKTTIPLINWDNPEPEPTPTEPPVGNNTTEPVPTPTPAPTPTPTDPVPTPTETPVEETGGSSGGSSHHSSSSSGSSGGTGGSPEPQKNVAAKDTAKVFVPNEKQVTFNFVNGVTTVNSISFTSRKIMGKLTAITEDLKSKSSLVKDLPEGKIYKSFNVWVGNAGYGDSDNILNAAVDFKVEKSWMQENNIDKSSIVLYKYNDKKKEWIELIPTITGEDDKFVYFTAKVPGYSSFLIAGKDAKTQLTEEPVNESVGGEVRSTGNGTVTTGAAKESPGFGLISGVACLLGVFLYKGKRV